MQKQLLASSIFLSLTTFAQGIPTYDAANILQSIKQVLAWEKQYQQMYEQLLNQTQQIQTARNQLQNMSGSRGYGTSINGIVNPILGTDIHQQMTGVADRQALLNISTTQLKNMLQASQNRSSQIQNLMSSINTTQDMKGAQEITARIQAEQVMAANEAKELQMLDQLGQQKRQQIDEDLKSKSQKMLRSKGALGE